MAIAHANLGLFSWTAVTIVSSKRAAAQGSTKMLHVCTCKGPSIPLWCQCSGRCSVGPVVLEVIFSVESGSHAHLELLTERPDLSVAHVAQSGVKCSLP